MNRTKFWIDTRDSFWFVPMIYSIASIILVFLTNLVDTWIISHFGDQLPKVLLTGEDVAVWLYGSLVTAILTMTTISFSTIMVVLTTYSTQFSPRTLQDFMRSSMTHQVLGVDCFGFIFALINLLLVDKQPLVTGPIVMVIIAVVNLAFFVYFIHYSSRWIQVNNLVGKLRNDASKVITHAYKKEKYGEYEVWNEDEINKLKRWPKKDIYAPRSGYVQYMEWGHIVKWAKKYNCVLDLHVQMGDFIPKGFPVMSVYDKKETMNIKEEIAATLVIGNERTDIEDIEFMIQKLVEIALRAISPAINDPHTAINCINRIGTTLSEIGSNYKEIYYISDASGNLRILNHPKKYEDYLYKSFYQMVHFAQGDVSIYYSLIEVLYKLALVSNTAIRQKIWNFHFYIIDTIAWDKLSDLDHNHLLSIYEKLEDSCKPSQ
ncbi:putative membrane protein [Virgibacillus halotolerans]|uniref:DUF2254 domain-containing protein n=1 Tax=Virgibacillus halotolerans TaxID=1071053 RepID=UPI0019622324|nr:DUF2254 domain-containing protein [Virgibacillus halotolerans]MBM7599867.1 putative membrane protein [Virgibacillus halotolerans]